MNNFQSNCATSDGFNSSGTCNSENRLAYKVKICRMKPGPISSPYSVFEGDCTGTVGAGLTLMLVEDS